MFKAMIGERILSGVWMETWTPEKVKEIYGDDWTESNAESWLILLDGRLFRITEDVSDGYRSHCRDIREVNNIMPVNWWQLSELVHGYYVSYWPGFCYMDPEDEVQWNEWWTNWWADEEMAIHSRSKGRGEQCDIHCFVSDVTKQPVFYFGTANTGDYYPTFVAKFLPENLGINQGRDNPAGLVDITGRAIQ